MQVGVSSYLNNSCYDYWKGRKCGTGDTILVMPCIGHLYPVLCSCQWKCMDMEIAIVILVSVHIVTVFGVM